MTLDEFKTALHSYRNQEFGSILMLILGLLVFGFPASFIEQRARTVGFDIWCILAAVTAFPLLGGWWFYWIARFPRKRMRKLGLVCPACQKPLVGISSQAVIATGKCGHCGTQYLSL